MSVCEYYPNNKYICEAESTASEKQNFIIQDELVWGLSYRHYKKKERDVPVPPKKSPMDIALKICREKEREDRKRSRTESKTSKRTSKSKASKVKSKVKKEPTLLEKSLMSQNQYMRYLSIPRKIVETPPPKKRKLPCDLGPCPPRFVQLSVPNKRRVYENWKAYHEMLPTEVIVRYEQMLHTDKNLEPREARYYYKKLDRKKKKELKKKREAQKKKQAEKRKGDQKWLEEQVELTTKAIMDYIKEQPLFTLSFQQLMLSNEMLSKLDQCKILKKPNRKTKNHYNKVIIESFDKLAVWMETLTKFVDVQAIDSDEDIAPVTVTSVEGEEEEEEEEEWEEGEEWEQEAVREEWKEEVEGEEWKEDLEEEFKEEVVEEVEEEEWKEEVEEAEHEIEGDIFKEAFKEAFLGEGEEGVWGADLFGEEGEELDVNLLALLIKLLENSPLEFLESYLEDEKMRNVKYADILERLKDLYEGKIARDESGMKPLEYVIVKWVEKLDPDKLDKNMLNEIHKAAELIGEWWKDESATQKEIAQVTSALKRWTDKELEGEEEYGFEEYEEEGKEEEARAVSEEEGEDKGEAEKEEDTGAKEDKLIIEMPVEAGEEEPFTISDITDITKEEEMLGQEGEGVEMAEKPLAVPGELELEAEGEGEEEEERLEVSVIYEPGMEITAAEVGQVIKGHKPSVTFEHSPTMVCCLSLKTWAVWLLEITHNAHNWTKWVHGVIQKVREFAATIRGDVVGDDGKKKVLYKQDWRDFAKEVDSMIVAWRQYSAHVNELSTSIVENFHGKEVKCCPKCLQDHLIKNVVTAHETLQALTEAMNCAGYWQRCLDEIVEKTSILAGKEDFAGKELEKDESSDDDSGDAYLEDVSQDEDDDDGVYDIEQIAVFGPEEPAVEEPDEKKVIKNASKSATKDKKGKGKDKKGKKK